MILMSIEIIDTLKQKNNKYFPLVDSNDLQGGYYQVRTHEEMTTIPDVRQKQGMLCYVQDEELIYILKTSGWEVFEVSGGSDDGANHPISSEPPEDLNAIWLDSSSHAVSNSFNHLLIAEFQTLLTTMQQQIAQLEARVSYLELNGSLTPSPLPPGTGGSNENGGVLLLESGDLLLWETGDSVLLEGQPSASPIGSSLLLLETGKKLLLETGDSVLLEHSLL